MTYKFSRWFLTVEARVRPHPCGICDIRNGTKIPSDFPCQLFHQCSVFNYLQINDSLWVRGQQRNSRNSLQQNNKNRTAYKVQHSSVLCLSCFWVTGRTVGDSETLSASVFHVKSNVTNEYSYSLSPGLKLKSGHWLWTVYCLWSCLILPNNWN